MSGSVRHRQIQQALSNGYGLGCANDDHHLGLTGKPTLLLT